MTKVETQEEIEILREGGKRLASTLNEVKKIIAPGIRTEELDREAKRIIEERGDVPSFLNYKPDFADRAYPASLCVCVNDELVHGIPGDRVIEDGDIVSIDLGVKHKGLHTDMAITVAVGKIDTKTQNLIDATRKALMKGISAARAGANVGDIGYAVNEYIKSCGLSIVKELGGHGIGKEVHEEPFIANFGEKGAGTKLTPGMVIALEPIVSAGSGRIKVSSDGFTYKTKDGSLGAHFEHTILITDDKPEILTIE